MTAPTVLDEAMNDVAIRAYVEQLLVPTLSSGDIDIMGNLPTHRIEAAGCEPLYLSPYSPNFNPSKTPSRNSRRFCEPKPSDPQSRISLILLSLSALSHEVPP